MTLDPRMLTFSLTRERETGQATLAHNGNQGWIIVICIPDCNHHFWNTFYFDWSNPTACLIAHVLWQSSWFFFPKLPLHLTTEDESSGPSPHTWDHWDLVQWHHWQEEAKKAGSCTQGIFSLTLHLTVTPLCDHWQTHNILGPVSSSILRWSDNI